VGGTGHPGLARLVLRGHRVTGQPGEDEAHAVDAGRGQVGRGHDVALGVERDLGLMTSAPELGALVSDFLIRPA
jgi:hypothetical protein